MSKLCVLALLFYNIATICCVSLDSNVNAYEDRADESKFSLLELFKAFNDKTRENRREVTESSLEHWTGRWMPDRVGDPTPPPKVWGPASGPTKATHAELHRIPMGDSEFCDDGKTDLSVDWDNSPVNYTCYGSKIMPSLAISPLLYSETIPHAYVAEHKCMNESIEYDDEMPLYGTHRPSWPVYGEYKFIPKQRWIHSLEHGALVMLYHPCANPLEIQRLKSLVTDCLRRHIISPYNLVDEDRPLVLITWGSRLSMSYVNTEIVTNFIRGTALRGPEEIPGDGSFKEGLLSKSRTVTDFSDSKICPNM